MRLHRFLVPLAAAIVVLGIFVVLLVALKGGNPKPNPNPNPPQVKATQPDPAPTADLGALVALKNQAEKLAIDGDLPGAHAKYREFFDLARGRDIKDPAYWSLMERATWDQDRVYLLLLSRKKTDPDGILTPAAAATRSTSPAVAVAATTQSFVDTYPPYRDLTTRPTTTQAARPAPATTAVSVAPTATTTPANPLNVADLPQPTRFKVVRTPRDPAGFSDQLVGQSLAQANEYLLTQFKDGEIQQGKELSETYRQGLNALVVYALLNSGQATGDRRLAVNGEFIRKAVERMKTHPMSTDTTKAQQPVVYARSLRAAVLAAGNRPEDRTVLKDDVQWLIDATTDGAYTYDDRFTVRVIPADLRGVGRNQVKPVPGPVGPSSVKPKTLGPTRSDQQPEPPPQPPQPAPNVGGKNAVGSARPSPWRITRVFALDGPEPIQLADGLHDPKTGMELGPPGTPRRYPPLPPPPNYPPAELPEKYGGTFVWDNSNTQYGLLGVAAGAEVGIEVPDAYWAAAEKHWLACQLAGGEWPYRKDVPGGRPAMTSGGIASLLATSDALEAPTIARVGRQPSPASQALAKAFAWLERGDNAINVMGPKTVYLGYNLHALSRVGLASGYKYLGPHDWYRDLSRKIVLSQWENGSWGRSEQPTADTLIDTAYTVLFLARGRHPIVMNKLRLDGPDGTIDRGEWNNRPRDLAGLCRFASRELERPVNWQIVSIEREPADWSDAPILYFASQAALTFSDAEVKKIRAFADGGGMLFTQADLGADAFNRFVDVLAKRAFPEFELKELSADHEVYSLQYIIPKASRPRLRGLSNGSRLLWVHSPQDLAVCWQQRAEKTKREAFELGVNLFVYAGGKTDLRNRLDERAIPAPAVEASTTIAVARLKYAGNWDPEPAAWERFARYIQWETSVGLNPVPVVLGQDGALKDFPIAHLAGTAAYTPTDAEVKALRDYVSAGGTLIAEGVGGADSTFAEALQSTILPKAFPAAKFDALPAEDRMLHATFQGMEDVWPPRLRPYAVQKLGQAVPAIRVAAVGKGRVIYLPLDATTGLAGANTWSIFGYEPNEAQALMKNVVLWSAEHAMR